jgi:DNA polymerase-3 subunit beta
MKIMKIKCDRKNLIEGISKVQGAVGTNATLPSLEGILFSAGNGYLTLTCYNMDMGITTAIEANIEKPGEIILSARYFSEIVKKMPGDDVLIEADENLMCTVKSGFSKFSIVGMAANEFPELPALSDGTSFSFHSDLLDNMIRMTRFAVAKTDDKPVYTGILFQLEQGKITMVSVDGYRLAIRKENITNDLELKFIVPEKTLSEILKLLPEKDEAIQISVGKRHIVFEIGHILVVSRLLEGEFIDYKTAVPPNHTTEVLVETKSLLDSIDRVALLINDRAKVFIKCIFDQNQIKASCESAIGNADDRIDAEIDGDRIEIGFNSRYLLDALRAVESDKVKLELSGPLSPIKILPPEGNDFLFLVLPVRIK